MGPVLVLFIAFGAGAVPFAGLAARAVAGVDLRRVGTGTVSGTGLYQVAGFVPLAVAGLLDVAKGAVGPLLAGGDRPVLAAAAGGLAVAGHNWSPLLRGAGGRGISPALGALVVLAWPGAVLLLGGMLVGRIWDEAGLGTFVAVVLLGPVLAITYGGIGALTGAALAAPILVKRAVGNRRDPAGEPRAWMYRLAFDAEPGEDRS